MSVGVLVSWKAMGDNFSYSQMPPHWNLCEQRQDNWQDKENRIEFGENLRKIGKKVPKFYINKCKKGIYGYF